VRRFRARRRSISLLRRAIDEAPPRPPVTAESKVPVLAAIIPALNASATIARCLDAITGQQSDDVEVIVVDDGSTDDTFEVASRYDVRLLKLPRNMGPSAARNRGAEMARAPVLFFLDADVALAPGALARARASMSRGDADAIIGSYDDDPAAKSTVSRFKNLAHHCFHQRSGAEVTTFWGACGLIRRETFFAVRGFDEQQFQIEDVELGYRMTARGIRIVLDRGLQVKHLKRWTLGSLIATDVWRRAVPWTLLRLEGRRLPADLNFSIDQRIAAIVAVALATLIPAAFFGFRLWIPVAALIAVAIWLNLDLYRLLFTKGGLWFSINGFILQQLYYLYSIFGIALGTAIYLARSLGRRDAAAAKRARD
jgi:glycosyltransferase involved in cell wall biosynthesis